MLHAQVHVCINTASQKCIATSGHSNLIRAFQTVLHMQLCNAKVSPTIQWFGCMYIGCHPVLYLGQMQAIDMR